MTRGEGHVGSDAKPVQHIVDDSGVLGRVDRQRFDAVELLCLQDEGSNFDDLRAGAKDQSEFHQGSLRRRRRLVTRYRVCTAWSYWVWAGVVEPIELAVGA